MPRYPRSDAEESGSYTGQAFEEEGKRRYGRAFIKDVWICTYAPWQSHPIVTFLFILYQEKGVPDYMQGSGRPYFAQPRSRSYREDGG